MSAEEAQTLAEQIREAAVQHPTIMAGAIAAAFGIPGEAFVRIVTEGDLARKRREIGPLLIQAREESNRLLRVLDDQAEVAYRDHVQPIKDRRDTSARVHQVILTRLEEMERDINAGTYEANVPSLEEIQIELQGA